MRLSTRGRYGLRALLDIAMHSSQGPVPLREVASRQKLSENYLEHLVGALRRSNMIKSIRGPGGGYLLSEEARQRTLGEIIRVLEGPIAPVECSSDSGECGESLEDCFIYGLWSQLSQEVNAVFDGKTLADILNDATAHRHLCGCNIENRAGDL